VTFRHGALRDTLTLTGDILPLSLAEYFSATTEDPLQNAREPLHYARPSSIVSDTRYRNLTPGAFRYLIGRRYERTKKAANDGGKGTPKSTVDQNDLRFTADRIATEHGVGRATVEREDEEGSWCSGWQ